MNTLASLPGKNRFRVIGLMSGTSADGIDAALMEVRTRGDSLRITCLGFLTVPYPRGFRALVMQNSIDRTSSVEDITRLNVLVGMLFADAARQVAKRSGYKLRDIDLIGSHGQTIHHLPLSKRIAGRSVHGTLQIGDIDVIAKETGVVTVGDFRAGDVAVGGSGAPLIPAFDFLMLADPKLNRGLLNIGGIANLTVLPAGGSINGVVAFDTGPGNMLIDALCRKLFRQPFDPEGSIASSGRILTPLLRDLLANPWLRRRLPKSTGREMFGDSLADRILKKFRNAESRDLIATVTEFTVLSIYDAYMRYVHKQTRIDELFVSGGGAKNAYMMEGLQMYFNGLRVTASDVLGIGADAKEAIAFGVFAVQTIRGIPQNIPGVTGAKRPAILGKIALP